ncbi:hypothetical protein IE81DRAFT_258749 [Ceraceosorus guamensis]|uniref:HMG box domain-containing protein n=1 Tax=Ceraceosorus guamensis TaxID=1522189 RepID=A0A316VTH9_9BASI|nr:hypothetical protein IE81DRAFT_258749 [Ceraceosorus guamensis]PWN39733.1 hypothetical protein IE81DRAFT_258749 [Ceraceosorus guamensis]
MSRVEKGGTRFKPQIRPRAGIRSTQPGPSAPASSLESAQAGSLSESVGPQAQPQAQAQAEAQAQAQPQSQSQSKEPHSIGGAPGASRYLFAAEEGDEEEDRLPTTASSSKSQLPPIIASKSGQNVSASATKRASKAILTPTAPSPSPSPPPQARSALASAQSGQSQSNGGTGALPPQPPAAEAAAIGESRDGRHGQRDEEVGAALDKSGGAKSNGDDLSSKDRGAVGSSAGDAASRPSLSATSPPSTSGASSPSITRAPMPPPPAPASRTSSNNQNNVAHTQSFVRAPRTIGLMPIKPLVSRASSASLRAPSLSPAPGLRADRSSATPAPSAAASARLRGMSATPMPESLSRRENVAPPEISSARKAREASVLSEAGMRGATPARVQAPTSPVVARGDGAATVERGALSDIEPAQSATSTKARAPWEVASVETSAGEQIEVGSAPWDALVRGEAATGVPQNEQAAPPKRPRGRPKKSTAAVDAAANGDSDRQAEIGSEVPQRRPRGRPKKLNSAAAASVDTEVGSNAGPASQGEAPAKRPRGRPRKAGAATAAVSAPQHQEQETSADGSRKSRSRAEIVSPLRGESTSQAHLDGDAEEQAEEASDDSAEEYFPSVTARRGRGRGGGRTSGGADTRQSTEDASASAHPVPESGKSKRRAKLKLPDDAPKRPANAYMRFSAQQRALHWADQNGASFGEVAQKIAERWAEVSAAEKGERAQRAKQELEAWRINMAQWKRDNPEWAEKLDARKRKKGTLTDGETADEGATTDASAGATERKATKTPRKRSVRKPTHGEGSDSEAGSTKRRRGGGKRKDVGISDDESAYAAELAAVGGNERLLEVSQGTRMAELSQPEVRMGRAGARTFELRRTYRKMIKDKKKELPERRMLAARKDKGSLRAEELEEEERRKRSSKSLPAARKEVQQAQNEDEVEEEEVFDVDSDGEPIAPSSPAGSASPTPSGFSNNSSAHALKNNKNSVQVRMSNGRLVLDESTLQVDRAAEYEGEDRIVIEENEKDKFINSASFSDRRGHQRWDKEQTLAFYAVSISFSTRRDCPLCCFLIACCSLVILYRLYRNGARTLR